jgi:tetratricopeptide (TPR) repeat protein
MRLADVLRLQGRDAEATDKYLKLLEANPHALDGQFTQIVDGLHDQPELLKRLRDTYAAASAKQPDDATFHSFIGHISVSLADLPRAAESFGRWAQLQPTNLEAHRNYTLVLSDTRQYQRAVAEAQALLALAQQQQVAADQKAAIESLVNFLQQQAALGR